MWREPYGLTAAVDVVDGKPVHSYTSGHQRDLPEVILVPGLGAPGYLVPWARRTAEWTKATVLDLPGWRRGRTRSCSPTLDHIAETITGWLQTTERAYVVLLGHSTGSQAVLRAALEAPDRMAAVVLAGPTFDPAARHWPTLIARTVRTLRHETPALVPAVLSSYLRSGGFALLHFVHSAKPDRPEDDIECLRVPRLVVTGEHDGFAPPSWARTLAAHAGTAPLVLPGAHCFCFTHVDAADRALRHFLVELSR